MGPQGRRYCRAAGVTVLGVPMEILFQVLSFLGWLAGLLAASFCLLLYFDHRAWAREYYAPGDRAGRPGFNLGAGIVKMKTRAKLGQVLILSAFLLSLPIGFVLQTTTAYVLGGAYALVAFYLALFKWSEDEEDGPSDF